MHAQAAAVAADDADFGVFHLPLRFHFTAAQLARRFGYVQHAFDMRLREQATVSIDRQLAADFDAAVLDEVFGFALFTKALILERDYRRDREAVVDLGEVHVLRREPGHFVSERR